jgi:hypothetical protein
MGYDLHLDPELGNARRLSDNGAMVGPDFSHTGGVARPSRLLRVSEALGPPRPTSRARAWDEAEELADPLLNRYTLADATEAMRG